MQTKNRLLVEGAEQCVVRGVFAPQNTATPTITEGLGLFTVTRTGVGVYNVVFTEAYPGTPCVTLGLSITTLNASIVQTSWTSATKTLVLSAFTCTTGAALEIVGNANNQVSFHAQFRLTTGSSVG